MLFLRSIRRLLEMVSCWEQKVFRMNAGHGTDSVCLSHYSGNYCTLKPRTQCSSEVRVKQGVKTNSPLPTLHYVSSSGHTVAFVVSTKPKPDVSLSSF
ncbi:uncharacterized [Tachysurus ichikawai]